MRIRPIGEFTILYQPRTRVRTKPDFCDLFLESLCIGGTEPLYHVVSASVELCLSLITELVHGDAVNPSDFLQLC